ncbi:MAG: DUF6165 family protein [Pirellulales bacterium]
MEAQRELLGRAKHLQSNGDLPSAIQIYKDTLTLTPDCPDALAFLGAAYLAQGRFEDAEPTLRAAIAQRADYPAAHDNLGIVLAKLGKQSEAEASFRESLRLNPNQGETHSNLGFALLKQKRWEDAVTSFRTAIKLNPDHEAAYKGLGRALTKLGKPDEAVACLREQVRLKPLLPQAHFNLAMALAELNKLDEAVACYREVLRLNPKSAEAYINLGNVLKSQGNYDESVATYQEALRLHPDRPETLNNLGTAYLVQGNLQDARAQIERAKQLQPDRIESYINLGTVLAEQGLIEESLASYDEGMRREPNNAEVHYSLAVTLSKFSRFTDAQASFRKAIELKPDYAQAHTHHALLCLQMGDYQQGWAGYDWRWDCKEFGTKPGGHRPMWDGSSLQGKKILLHAEQGLGDTLQFIRYAQLLKNQGAYVMLGCPKALAPLLNRYPGLDVCFVPGSPIPQYDVEAPLMSLPRLCGTTLDTVPRRVPYLTADSRLIDAWRAELQAIPGFKIGIVWQGNPKYACDRQRSVPLRHFAPLAEVEGVQLISLQKGPGTEQLAAVADQFPVIDLGSRLDNETGAFMDTAAVMASLDLVISIDTSVTHLAGALEVPVWLALANFADWRWLRDRDDSPWYPTVRLFRQTTPGDWEDVFRRMAEELKTRVHLARTSLTPLIEVSVGELIDKITILEIKTERIDDAAKLANIRRELESLEATRQKIVSPSEQLSQLTAELKAVNIAIWDVEEDLRHCERDGNFDARFIELARSVYRNNDRRSFLKRQINDSLGSKLIEEKSYKL